jgi:hypothetical protein
MDGRLAAIEPSLTMVAEDDATGPVARTENDRGGSEPRQRSSGPF